MNVVRALTLSDPIDADLATLHSKERAEDREAYYRDRAIKALQKDEDAACAWLADRAGVTEVTDETAQLAALVAMKDADAVKALQALRAKFRAWLPGCPLVDAKAEELDDNDRAKGYV